MDIQTAKHLIDDYIESIVKKHGDKAEIGVEITIRGISEENRPQCSDEIAQTLGREGYDVDSWLCCDTIRVSDKELED